MTDQEFIDQLKNLDDSIMLIKTMSMIVSLGYIRSIISKQVLDQNERMALRLVSSMKHTYLDLQKRGVKSNWKKMKYQCVVYQPTTGWVDITSGQIVKNGNVNV